MLNTARNITPIILAGGKGTRLRPLTSPSRPKPLLKLPGQRLSLLEQTLQRCGFLNPPIIVSDVLYVDKVVNIAPDNATVICEPVGRSTAAAITLAALQIKDPSRIVSIIPSDHHISDVTIFRTAIEAAADQLNKYDYALLAVPATSPQTRYGYIRTNAAHKILLFVEKPDQKKAELLIQEEYIYWNTGIFLTRASTLLNDIKKYKSDTYRYCKNALDHAHCAGNQITPNIDWYQKCETISIDYALMEHIDNASLTPLNTYWSDVGCWPALLDLTLRRLRA